LAWCSIKDNHVLTVQQTVSKEKNRRGSSLPGMYQAILKKLTGISIKEKGRKTAILLRLSAFKFTPTVSDSGNYYQKISWHRDFNCLYA
jgi:hypothetical protein